MGRINANGNPFLVERAEGGFTYFRNIPPALRAAAAGEVALPWTGERRAVGGRATIKIALGTRDIALARKRWFDIHPQVEDIIEVARLRQVRSKRPETPRAVTGLSPSDIETMAKRYYQQILSRDDDEVLRDDTLADQTEIVLEEAGWSKSDPGAIRAARREAHERELGALTRGLEDMKAFDYDSSSLVPRLASLTADGHSEASARAIRQMLDDAVGENEIDAVLAENGVTIPRVHPDRRRLVLALLRSGMEAHQDVLARLDGKPVQTPVPIAPLKLPDPDEGSKLRDAYKAWKVQQKPADKTAEEYGVYVERFIAINGNLSTRSITKKHVLAYRDGLSLFPRNVPADLREANVEAIQEWAAKKRAKLLSRSTINDKAIGAISAILAVALNHDEIPSNPCAGTKFKLKEGEIIERQPYADRDLEKLLLSAVFAKGKRYSAGGGEAQKWLPLISMYSGARLEEIGQLRTADIRSQDGIHYFDMETIDDTPGQETHRKTKSSRRKVPVHQRLIELGLLTYVAAQRKVGAVRLFPLLTPYRGKITHGFSKWWGRYARKFVPVEENKTFHSFRHRVTDQFRNQAKPLYAVMQEVLGHDVSDTTSGYGSGFDLPTLNSAVQALDYGPKIEKHLRAIVSAAAPRQRR
ncbi:MAG: site-specific integrase [Bosea sp.]|uniref:site-specific integrase n=1 Tax=Bosea sp. (in: a-proteobacteria) TaxID=1871050 RepID=UPI001AC18FB7|nr:site-specific integrase [Bosea sp. (in: a-proteobacteria)]MBN9452280.1 site-specific integrase [Bosea sp. (in: a-proteobacteria)]